MAIYEVSARTTLVTATAAAALCALKGVTRPCFIKEIHIFGITAPTTSGALGLCRSTAVGTGTLTSVVPVSRDPNATAPTAVLITNWATAAPTNGGVGAVFRRWTQSAAIGNGVIWTFDGDDGIEVVGGAAATSELCVVNMVATAPGTFDITVVYVE